MRKPMVAGNWKMHGARSSVSDLLSNIISESNGPLETELAVFPPYVFLEQVQHLLSPTNIAWGAQNLSQQTSGAFTGEISAAMLLEFGCRYVIIGHSERRTLYGETDSIVAAKCIAATAAGLKPVLCVGETLAERQAGQTEQIIQRQLDAVFSAACSPAVIAYEPVWAIGTGMTASPEQAQTVHSFIRQYLAKYDENIAQQLRIIYGGSVKAGNAKTLFAMPDIDGGLIGGASLDAKEFIEIAKSCKH